MRRLWPLVLLLLSQPLAADTPWAEAVARYQAASRSGDATAITAAIAHALELRPDYPRLMLGLADAKATQGDGDAAFALLGRLADQGLSFALDERAGLTPLRTDPRYAALVARFTANATPRPAGRELLRIDAPRLVPEGLAIDARSGTRYLGGVHERRILRITRDGRVSDFVASGRDGLMSVIGVALDARRGLLWAASSGMPEMQGYSEADAGRAALFAFALDDSRLVHRYAAPAGVRMLGDLTLADDGRLFVSDPLGGSVYRVADGVYTPIHAPGLIASPQGLVVSADGTALVVADYAQGLMRIALSDGAVTRVVTPDDLNTYGIDGLVREGDRVVAVQNGLRPHRVLAATLSRDGQRLADWRALAVADPRWSEPTLGVLQRGRFQFVANSQWDRFDPGTHALREDPPLRGPLLLELRVR